MNADLLRLEALLDDALERGEGAEREAFIVGACGGDSLLEQALRKLIAAHSAAGEGFLKSPTQMSAAEMTRASFHPESQGDRIGPYKLMHQIGEGGFGTVWMADQEEPVRRIVALKIIKVGMDTKEVIARFEQERQALAMMDHPNIAKVFHAGATQYGRPYFAMELVQGDPITKYCEQRALTIRERIELFIRACQAVQHAHQKGVIHRDIKPSNVMVTMIEGAAVPKVIDFGVAKATKKLTNLTFFTACEQIIGTPGYMSPEQAELTSIDIDTRSDIYSLGVLLYELLTGRLPVDANTLQQVGLDEMRRLIREVDPPRPSAFVKSMDDRELNQIAIARRTDAARLPGLLRGELDWIVMKCLEKDRRRRYETANGLVLDLERYLKDEPVSARPPSKMYRFCKTARRHRAGFFAGAVVILALLAVAISSTYFYLRESDAFRRFKVAESALAASEERHVFEEAMSAGLMGDADRMLSAMADARDRISLPQFLLLRGGHALLVGQYDEAIRDLEASASAPSKSAAALGLLATAHFLNGQWEAYERDMMQLRPLTPNRAHPEDAIFKGLAVGYGWPEDGIALLDQAPPSAITQAVRAEIGIWRAMRSGNPQHALDAVSAIERAKSFAHENPAVLRMSVSARLIASSLDVPNRAEHLAEADREAGKLQTIFAKTPNLPGAVIMRALQLQARGRDDEAAAMLARQYESTRNGFIAQRHALELFRLGQTKEAAAIINPARAAADGFFHLRMLAELEDGPSRAEAGYHQFRERYAGLAGELFAPLIPLLLGKKELALTDARAFRDRAGENLKRWPAPFPQIAEFLAGEIDAATLLRLAGNAPLALSESHNVVGYSLLAEGKRKEAREHFRQAVEAGAFLSNAFLDSRITLARMDSDPSWPSWIQ